MLGDIYYHKLLLSRHSRPGEPPNIQCHQDDWRGKRSAYVEKSHVEPMMVHIDVRNMSGSYVTHQKSVKTHYLHNCNYRVDVPHFMTEFALVFDEAFSYVQVHDLDSDEAIGHDKHGNVKKDTFDWFEKRRSYGTELLVGMGAGIRAERIKSYQRERADVWNLVQDRNRFLRHGHYFGND